MDVTLLTQAHCGACSHARGILDRVAADFPLNVVTVDIESEAGRNLAVGAWVLFPPGVLVDGKLLSYGRLSERKLRRTLERLDVQ